MRQNRDAAWHEPVIQLRRKGGCYV